jgi:protein Cut8
MGASTSSVGMPSRKRLRNNVQQGRPLPLERVLETVDANTLKTILLTMCDKRPEFAKELSDLAPRPTVSTALSTLDIYEKSYRSAFPYGPNQTGDYAHNRVRPALVQLLDALSDYVPHFLPPSESQASVSLAFLDGATDIIHRLPDWSNPLHNNSKQTAYEEITKAWILVIQEAAKRGGGISLQYGGWESKLSKHNDLSGGRMHLATSQMRQTVGWVGDSNNGGRIQRASVGLGFGMQSGAGVPVGSW